MARVMCDSTTLNDIPLWCDIPGTYANGVYAVPIAEVRRRFPGKPLARFNVNGDPAWGNVLDIERYDATPAGAPRWYDGRKADGERYLALYVNEGNIAAAVKAMAGRPWFCILATLNGKVPLTAGGRTVDAVQAYGQQANGGQHYDLSVVLNDAWHPQPWVVRSAAMIADARAQLGGHF